jgi:preprotein translocase subunit YajC
MMTALMLLAIVVAAGIVTFIVTRNQETDSKEHLKNVH